MSRVFERLSIQRNIHDNIGVDDRCGCLENLRVVPDNIRFNDSGRSLENSGIVDVQIQALTDCTVNDKLCAALGDVLTFKVDFFEIVEVGFSSDKLIAIAGEK